MKPVLLITLTLVALLQCSACVQRSGSGKGPASQQPAPLETQDGQEIKGGVLRLPLSIGIDDPALKSLDFTDPRLFALGRCLELPLQRAQADGSLASGLADSHLTVDNGRSWTFRLRTAPGQEDDPDYLGRLYDQRLREVLRGRATPLKAQLCDLLQGAQAYAENRQDSIAGLKLEGGSLTLALNRPNMVFPRWVSQPGLGVLLSGDIETLPVGGFGPFGLQVIEGQELVLRPNPDSLCGTPVVDELRFLCEPDTAAQVSAFREGKLHAANMPWDQVAALQADNELGARLRRLDTAAVYLGLFNHNRFPWGDQSFQSKLGLRRALNEALDVAQISELCGGQLAVWRHFVAPCFQDAIAAADIRRPLFADGLNAEAAKASLKEADHEQGSHLIPGSDLAYRNGLVEKQLVLEVLRFWNEVSVKMRPFPLTASEQELRVSRDRTDIVLVRHCPAYPDVDAALYPLLHSRLLGNGGNLLLLRKPELDKLLADGQAAAAGVARLKLYQALCRQAEEEALAVFIGNSTPSILLSPKLAGLNLGHYDYDASLPAQDFSQLGLISD